MFAISRLTLLLLLTFGAALGAAAGDAVAGKAKAVMCAGCHGREGISVIPRYPNLACQREVYLVKAINDYRSGVREEPMMLLMVGALTDDDVANLAAYYSTVNCKGYLGLE